MFLPESIKKTNKTYIRKPKKNVIFGKKWSKNIKTNKIINLSGAFAFGFFSPNPKDGAFELLEEHSLVKLQRPLPQGGLGAPGAGGKAGAAGRTVRFFCQFLA